MNIMLRHKRSNLKRKRQLVCLTFLFFGGCLLTGLFAVPSLKKKGHSTASVHNGGFKARSLLSLGSGRVAEFGVTSKSGDNNSHSYVPGAGWHEIDLKEAGGDEYECVKPGNSESELFPPDLFTEEQLSDGAVVLYAIGILYTFYALSIVCDRYFVPCIEIYVEAFGLAPDVAGATIMAAAESAPELATNIVGVFVAYSDVGVGTIIGSAVFNVLAIIAFCSFFSTGVVVLTPWPLARDTFFYSISLILLTVFFFDDQVHWWESLILIVWYVAYVLFMLVNGWCETRFNRVFTCCSGGGKDGAVKPELSARALSSGEPNQENPKLSSVAASEISLEIDHKKGEHEGSEKHQERSDDDEEFEDDLCKGPLGRSFLGSLVWFVSAPILLVLWLTVPDPNRPACSRSVRPWAFHLTFLGSVVWISLLTYLMVWWAAVTGRVAGISDTVMGLTFLAAGTSVPDLMSSILVTRQGEGDMALSSCIGSNIFDVTICLPLPWIIHSLVNSSPMSVISEGIVCNVGMLLLMLFLLFVLLMIFRWRLSKIMGLTLVVLHVGFILFSIGLSTCFIPCHVVF